MQRTDDELIRACRKGDESAWEEIVLKYQKLIFSIPRRAGLGRDLASDVLQDVFTALFEKLDTIEKPEFLRSWLMTTARHKTMHLIQRETRGRPVPIDDDDSETVLQLPSDAPGADEVLVAIERECQAAIAFSRIDERCRRLISMLYLEAETVPYEQAAAALGIPLGSIGPTRARCLQKMMKLLPERVSDVFFNRSN